MDETVNKGHALEIVASAGGDHRTNAGEGDVADEAHGCQLVVKLDYGGFAAANGVIGGFLCSVGHSYFIF